MATMNDTGGASDLPAFDPERHGVPAYKDIQTDADLIAHSKAYLNECVSHYDVDADMSHVVSWDVSHRAKRRAAAVRHMDVSDFGVMSMTGFSELSDERWAELQEEYGDRVRRGDNPFTHLKDVEIVLTWDAYENFSREEWYETLRHELVHVVQVHLYGTGDHSFDFKQRADRLHAPEDCPQFSDFDYRLVCRECGELVCGRYRRSKIVKFAEKSEAEQQEIKDNGGKYWYGECCNAFLTAE